MAITTHPNRTREATDHHRPLSVSVLTGLLAVLAIAAIQGGVAMLIDPVEPLGMTAAELERAPVDTYVWPGLFLIGIAAASLVTVVGIAIGWRWGWAAGVERRFGHRWPWLAALTTGGVLLVFEIIELYIVPFHPIMHPALIIWSLMIIALTLSPSVEAFVDVHPGD